MRKQEMLLQLARKRQRSRLDGYACIGDFHDGIFECDFVSPWTRSGCNLDADVMVIGQDWTSEDNLSGPVPDHDSLHLGYSRKWPTNRNLDDLLLRHFALDRSDCYLTNVFPFIKPGGATSNIRMRDLTKCALEYTLPEMKIVQPQLAICLGKVAFVALAKATNQKVPSKMSDAIDNPFNHQQTSIHCVAHTGALGMNNRGREQVDRDWQALAATLQD